MVDYQRSFYSKMSLAGSPHTGAVTSVSPSMDWQSAGLWQSDGEFWTLAGSAWPNDAVVCSLSQILLTDGVPKRFSLSPTACRGILRRAAKRGKQLPPALAAALEAVANQP
jgi:hypothetical protein